jgi:hypothetical protein
MILSSVLGAGIGSAYAYAWKRDILDLMYDHNNFTIIIHNISILYNFFIYKYFFYL